MTLKEFDHHHITTVQFPLALSLGLAVEDGAAAIGPAATPDLFITSHANSLALIKLVLFANFLINLGRAIHISVYRLVNEAMDKHILHDDISKSIYCVTSIA